MRKNISCSHPQVGRFCRDDFRFGWRAAGVGTATGVGLGGVTWSVEVATCVARFRGAGLQRKKYNFES